MGIEKKSKKDKSEKAEKSKKKVKAEKAPKEKQLTRVQYIHDTVTAAGKSGIKIEDLIAKVDKKFNYEEGKTSRMRVNNTIKDSKSLKLNDGVVTPK